MIGIPCTKKCFLISKLFSFCDLAMCPILRVREIYEREKALQTLKFHPRVTYIPIPAFITIKETCPPVLARRGIESVGKGNCLPEGAVMSAGDTLWPGPMLAWGVGRSRLPVGGPRGSGPKRGTNRPPPTNPNYLVYQLPHDAL